MIGINKFRESPEQIKQAQKKRGEDPDIVEKVAEIDTQWRSKLQELEQKQQKRNKATDKIAELKRKGEDASDQIQSMKNLKQEIENLETKVEELKSQRDDLRYKVGNTLHPDVPAGESEDDNVEIRSWSPDENVESEEVLAADVMEKHGLLSSSKAAEVGGERAYYLSAPLFQLSQALINFASDFLLQQNYQVQQVPYMLERESILAAVDIETFEDQLYEVGDRERYLIGTSEHALAAKYQEEVIEDDLPLKLGGFSTNFRGEAGKHGEQTRGIWRVHQFEKVEQFVFCRPENHLQILDETLRNAEQIMKKLELPYRVVDICDGDISKKTYRQYDIEVLRPELGEYGEVGSYGSCTDYQSREFNTKYFESGERKHPYTVYATALVPQRIITALIENRYANGKLHVPDALQSYIGGKQKLDLSKQNKG